MYRFPKSYNSANVFILTNVVIEITSSVIVTQLLNWKGWSFKLSSAVGGILLQNIFVILIVWIFSCSLPRGVLRKRCSENMQNIYRKTRMPKYDLSCKVAKELCWNHTFLHGCFPVNLPLFFRTPFLKNTSGGLLLKRLEAF